MAEAKRERFGSRLGFILISAGCAIGLGNVWRFPYITGEYGGAAFVLMYLVFLVILGLPVMVMEFAVGRASQKSAAAAFDTLQPSRKWHWFSWWGYIGCMVLMMFYTTVGGWMLSFVVKMGTGAFNGLDSAGVGEVFNAMLANPTELVGWMLVVIVLGFLVCSLGLQKGVERITKVMMICLLGIMAVLVVRAVTLPGGLEGLKFYLIPDFGKLFAGATTAEQWATFGDAVYAAMGQAFFTLSLGISAMEIFGSYIGKERSLTGEALRICGLDTAVALMAGLIIFPACFTFGVDQTAGPSLIFITLPNIFANMALGRLWGSLFFLFMAFAALSTVLAVFENIICCGMELTGCTRKKSSLVNLFLIILLSMPCVLGYNLWAWDGFAVFGGAVLDFEDFLVSNLFLPLGSLVYLLFCVSRYGWGWDNYKKEVNTGKGLKIHDWMRGYLTYGLPVIVLFIFAFGIYDKFFA